AIPEDERFPWQPKELVAVLGQHRDVSGGPVGVYSVALRGDGKQLASGGPGPRVFLWDLTGAKLQAPVTLDGHTDSVFSVAFAADGQRLASASKDKTARLWDMRKPGTNTSTVLPHQHYVRAVAFAPYGDVLASASEGNHEVYLWDPMGREPKKVL